MTSVCLCLKKISCAFIADKWKWGHGIQNALQPLNHLHNEEFKLNFPCGLWITFISAQFKDKAPSDISTL